jgi:hypothetical protein
LRFTFTITITILEGYAFAPIGFADDAGCGLSAPECALHGGVCVCLWGCKDAG